MIELIERYESTGSHPDEIIWQVWKDGTRKCCGPKPVPHESVIDLICELNDGLARFQSLERALPGNFWSFES